MICVHLYCKNNTYLSRFFYHIFKFCKSVQREYAQIIILFFFNVVDINLKHNVILYFLIIFRINVENENFFFFLGFFFVNFVLIVNVYLALYKDFFFLNVNYIIYSNNLLFNKKNAFSKIPTKHNSFQHNHFLEIISVFYQTHYFQQNVF